MYIAQGIAVDIGSQQGGIACQDNAAGPGYILYSEQNVHTRFSTDPVYHQNANHLNCVQFTVTQQVGHMTRTVIMQILNLP